jgi:hypothetical protein
MGGFFAVMQRNRRVPRGNLAEAERRFWRFFSIGFPSLRYRNSSPMVGASHLPGKVWAEPNPGGGAIFNLIVPTVAAAD